MIIHIAATKLNQSQNPRFFLVIFKQLYAYTNPLNSFRYFFFYLFIYIWLYFCLDRDLFSLYVFRLFFGTLCCCALNAFCKSYNLHGWLVGWLLCFVCFFVSFSCVLFYLQKRLFSHVSFEFSIVFCFFCFASFCRVILFHLKLFSFVYRFILYLSYCLFVHFSIILYIYIVRVTMFLVCLQ